MPPEKYPSDPRVAFALKLSGALHRYGVPTHRLESAMNSTLEKIGLEGQFFTMPTGVFASFGPPEEHRTSLLRMDAPEIDLGKMAEVDGVATGVVNGDFGFPEGSARIDHIIEQPAQYGRVLTTFCFGLGSGCAARFFDGGIYECVLAALIGLVVGFLAFRLGRSEDAAHIIVPVAACLATAVTLAASRVVEDLNVYTTTLASLVVLLPGFTLTTALIELATRHLVSGTARLMQVTLIFLEIGFGVALGGQLDRVIPHMHMHATAHSLPAWTLYLALIVAPFAFAVQFRAQPRDLGWILAVGLAGYGGGKLGFHMMGPQLGVFFGALFLGIGGNIYARRTNRPSAVPLVPGIMQMVPGSIGFSSISMMLQKEFVNGMEAGFETVIVGIALVTGLLLANVIYPAQKSI